MQKEKETRSCIMQTITQVSFQSRTLVSNIVNKMQGMNNSRKQFIINLFMLYLSLRGRYTFKGMERYGSMCEKSYRLHFEQDFDFLGFNLELANAHLSCSLVLAIDPSYLPKSGKHTPHLAKFWNGCAGRAEKGLEIGGLALVDLKRNTAFHLEAVQTPSPKELSTEGKTLVDHYAKVIVESAQFLKEMTAYLAVDGYFAKKAFINPIREQTHLHLICKLRQDADLKYLYTGPRRAGKGRPKKYDGKVKLSAIDKNKFEKVHEDEQVILYQALLWSVGLKRKLKVVYASFLDKGKATKRYALYFSTDLNLDGLSIYKYYKARFQIEFLFRDAKQHVGLTHCQARDDNKINFHVNASLSSVNIAKVGQLGIENKPFSMANAKTVHANQNMMDIFFQTFEIDPKLEENKLKIRRLAQYGLIAT